MANTSQARSVYQFNISYDGESHSIDTIFTQLDAWKDTFGGESVSYLITEEQFGILGVWQIRSKVLKVYITGARRAELFAQQLHIHFKKEKQSYQKDIFNLL